MKTFDLIFVLFFKKIGILNRDYFISKGIPKRERSFMEKLELNEKLLKNLKLFIDSKDKFKVSEKEIVDAKKEIKEVKSRIRKIKLKLRIIKELLKP